MARDVMYFMHYYGSEVCGRESRNICWSGVLLKSCWPARFLEPVAAGVAEVYIKQFPEYFTCRQASLVEAGAI